jgi:chromosome segregation ATPase
MVRRLQGNNINPEEKKLNTDYSAILASINSANIELAEIGKNKKRVLAETKEAIEESNKARQEAQNAAKTLEETKTKRNTALAEFKEFMSELSAKKEAMIASLPDVDTALADLEKLKAPIQASIDKLVKNKAEAQTSLDKINESIRIAKETETEIKKNIEDLVHSAKKLTSLIGTKKSEIIKLEKDAELYKNLEEGIKTHTETLAEINNKVIEASKELSSINSRIKTAHSELEKEIYEKEKTVLEANQTMKTLGSLEARIDAKIEIFKQYRDKFSVDELAKMKVSREL